MFNFKLERILFVSVEATFCEIQSILQLWAQESPLGLKEHR